MDITPFPDIIVGGGESVLEFGRWDEVQVITLQLNALFHGRKMVFLSLSQGRIILQWRPFMKDKVALLKPNHFKRQNLPAKI